jgi:hydroxymethylglutaryl-CoA lyase
MTSAPKSAKSWPQKGPARSWSAIESRPPACCQPEGERRPHLHSQAMVALPASVEIVEVSPRDGLQNDQVQLPTSEKIALIERAVAAGIRRVEVASFVSPRRVPQMADAEAVIAGLPTGTGVTYTGLVLNERGAERALTTGLDEWNFVVAASDTFNVRNQGVPTGESIKAFTRIAAMAAGARVNTSVVISTAFGCPFEGEVPVARMAEVVRAVADAGAAEISLADTIGVAVPTDVTERVEVARQAAPHVAQRVHFHNTRNTGLANVVAAVSAGVGAIDASLGGIGGCPFAPAATGNVPTEDVVYLLERMGVRTGLSLPALLDAVRWLDGVLGRPTPGMLVKAGLFPPRPAV